MARKSISQQLSELRTYCIKLENELACTRQVGQQNANLLRKAREHISTLEKELDGSQNRTNRSVSSIRAPGGVAHQVSLSERAKAYCASHGVKAVDKQTLLAWVP